MNTMINRSDALRSRTLVAFPVAATPAPQACMAASPLGFGGGALTSTTGLFGEWSRPMAAASLNARHNSITNPIHAARVRTAVVGATDATPAAVATVDAYAGRKQGSPPRGEPR